MLVLVGVLPVKPEKLDDAIALCRSMLAPSQAEAGCFSYDFYQHHADPCRIVFVETWESRAALDAHFETPHFKAFFAAIPDLAASEPAIDVYDHVQHARL